MRIVGHGVDIVRCDRIERLWKEHGDHFLKRTYTAAERDYCINSRVTVTRLSGRFAAKEAVLKVLGTGWRGELRWTDIETLADAQGKPEVTLHGATAALARELGIAEIQISISHTDEYAIASAIGVGE